MSAIEREYHYSNGSIAACDDQQCCGFVEHLTLAEAVERWKHETGDRP